MAFKCIIILAFIACAQAGGPAAYSISAPSVDYGSIGHSSEHTVKGYGGQNVHSQYAKSVDTAHSSVRVASSRSSNDGIAYAHAPAYSYGAAYHAPAVSYAAPAYHAPAVSYAAPAYHARAVSYAAPAYHAPAVSYAAPAYHAPALSYGAPALAYSHGLSHGYAAPALAVKAPVAYAAHGGFAHSSFSGLGANYAW